MGDYAKKPANYKRGRCKEFERLHREKLKLGGTIAAEKRCERSFPCLANMMVFAGLEQPCDSCAPHIQDMRDMSSWERHPATHGTFYTSKHITTDQQQLIEHRITQADIRNWINSEAE